MNDLISEKGDFLGYEDLFSYFQVNVTFLDFYNLLHCIPGAWKCNINDKLKVVKQKDLESVINLKKVCQGTYWKYFDEPKTRTHIQKWNNVLNLNLSLEDWSELYLINYKCSYESKMRYFQYKILMRTLTTNKYLKICKIKDIDSCYFCEKEVESIEHLFWFCKIFNKYWKDVIGLLEPYLGWSSYMNSKSVILGYTTRSSCQFLVNHIINIVKNYIYVTKYCGKNLSVKNTIHFIKQYYIIEQNILEVYEEKPYKLQEKWSFISDFLNNF